MAISVTALELLELAEKRSIPSALDIAWERRTGVNPIIRAYEYLRALREKKRIRIQIGYCALLGIIGGLISFLLGISTGAGKIAAIVTSIFCFVTIGTALMTLLQTKLPDVIQVELFWLDYQSFLRWAPSVSNEIRRLDLAGLQHEAKAVLLELASQVIPFPKEEEMNHIEWNEYALLMKDFKMRFETMSRLGLTEGSPTFYLNEARRERDRREKAARPVAI
jgi:hypothetical protein